MASAADMVMSQSLWEKAFNSLDDNVQSGLNSTRTHKRDVLAAVLKEVEGKKQLCLQKRWKFKKPNGDVVIVRDVLEKISLWVDRFKEVGDTVVQYDPAHAALPWAAFRFLLQTAVSEVQLFGAMVSDLEVIARLITRYGEFECQYLQRTKLQPTLVEALTSFYAEILTHLARIVRYFQEKDLVRLVKSPFRTVNSEYMQKILTREDEVLKIAKLADTETLHFLEAAIIRLSAQGVISSRSLSDEKYTKILDWLAASPYYNHHQYVSQSRLPSCGDWLLRHKAYLDWHTSSSSAILLLHGITGSGKTTLCSKVVDSFLAAVAQAPSAAPLAYFYCANPEFERARASPDDIMRTILGQLSIDPTQRGKMRDFLSSEYERQLATARVDGLELPKLRTRDCVRLILELAEQDPLTIVVDAVDSIDKEERHIFLNALKQIALNADNVVKIFVTSRSENRVLAAMEADMEINITSQDVRDDIESFVRNEVEMAVDNKMLLEGQVSSHLRAMLEQVLIDGAGEMFLWVKLQVHRLCREVVEKDVIAALQNKLPEDLDRLYRDTLSHILGAGPAAQALAVQIFSWVLYMREPLRPSALLAALTDESNSTLQLTQLLGICANMVVFDAKCNVLRFAHQSFQEFLHRHQSFTAASAHSTLASVCINTCSRGSGADESLQIPRDSDDLYTYAAMYWPLHYKLSHGSDTYASLCQSIIAFIFDEDFDTTLSFDAWLKSVRKLIPLLPNDHAMKPALDSIPVSDTGFIFLISVFGLDTLLDSVLSNLPDLDFNEENNLGHTPVYLAAALGHLDTVSMLVDHGSDVDVECGRYGSPLHAACFSGHVEVVDRLLQLGANTSCGAVFDNALQAAFRGSRENVALHILDKAAMINTEDAYEQAVEGAAQAGLVGVVEHLQLPVFVRLRQNKRENPDKTRKKTKKAIEAGQIGVLREFLKPHADVTDLLPPDAVALATLRNHRDIVDFLLDRGMDIESEGCLGTPLRAACLLNCSAIARLLLDRGADINACSGTMGAALQASALQGHTSIIKLLIDEGADVNQNSGFYGTALQAAAYHGQNSAVELLLDAGADVHAKGFSKDAFHAAAEGGHQDVLMLMLNRGYRFHHTPPGPMYSKSPPSRYRALLRDASPGAEHHSGSRSKRKKDRGHPSSDVSRPSPVSDLYTIFRLARGYDIGLEATQDAARGYSPRGYTRRENWPLEASASAGHTETVSMLLQQREVLHIEEEEFTAAVQLAAQKGHFPVLQTLLDDVAERQPIDDYFVNICRTAHGSKQPQAVNNLLALSSEYCSAQCVAKMREEFLPRMDKYQTSEEVSRDELISDFNNACVSGNIQLLGQILDTDYHSVLSPQELDVALQLCIVHGQTAMARILFDSALLRERLHFFEESYVAAAGYGDLDVIKLLTHHWRCNLSVPGTSAIRRALLASSKHGHIEVVRYLVEELSADVNTPAPDKPIAEGAHQLSDNGLFSRKSEHSSISEITPLRGVLRGFRKDPGHESLEEMLLNRRSGGKSAQGNYHEDVLMFLLSCGARPNDLGGGDKYPIQLAAKRCPLRIIKALISGGADVNAKSAGDTSLRAAARWPLRIIKALVPGGAEVNAKSAGDTALCAAAGRELSAASIVSSLLEAGATIPNNPDEAYRVLNQALRFFEGDATREYFHDCDDPDGRFLSSPSLQSVFEEGPAAVVYMLLSKMPQQRTSEDVRFGLLLQMAAFLDNHSYVDLLLSRGLDVNATGYYYGTALQAAARCGHERMVQKILHAGAEVNILQGRWGTALRAAIVGSHEAVVQTLLRHGADMTLKFKKQRLYVNDSEKTTDTALQLAVRSASLDIVKGLLVNGADAVLDHPETLHPLIVSAQMGNRDLVRVLLDYGAPVNVPGKVRPYYSHVIAEDASPIHAAAAGGHLSVIEELLTGGANIDHDVKHVGTPLKIAASEGRLSVVQKLLSAGASKARDTVLYEAVYRGHIDIVKTLLSSGATPDGRVLAAACENSERLDIVELLLENVYAGGQPDSAVDQAFSIQGLDDSVFLLLLDYAPITQKRLIQSCGAGSIRAVKLMLDQKTVDINGRDDESASYPLQVAASQLQAEVVRILLERGAEVCRNICKSGNGSPLMAVLETCAASRLRGISKQRAVELVPKLSLADDYEPDNYWRYYSGSDTNPSDFQRLSSCETIVRLLISHGANVNDDSRPFGPPLHLACLLGSKSIVELLLENGADVDATAGYFEKAIFAALEGGHSDIVAALLEKVPSTKHVHPDYATPLHLACDKGDGESVRRLLELGADATVINNQGETPLTLALKQEDRRSFMFGETRRESPLDVIMEIARPLRILDDDLVAAAEKGSYTGTLAKLLDTDPDMRISEQAICRMLGSYRTDQDILELVMKRNGGIGVTAGMLQAGCGEHTLERLLQYRPLCEITNEILESQADPKSMQLLLSLQKPDTDVTERVIFHALKIGGSGYGRRHRVLWDDQPQKEALEVLLERSPHIVVTQEMLKAAGCSMDWKILLERLEPGTRISHDVIETAANLERDEPSETMHLLLKFDPSIRLSPRLALKTIGYLNKVETLKILLEHDPTMPVTEKMFLRVFGTFPTSRESEREELAGIMYKYSKKLAFTEKIRRAIDHAYQSKSDAAKKERFYGLQATGEDVMEVEEESDDDKGDEDDSDGERSNTDESDDERTEGNSVTG